MTFAPGDGLPRRESATALDGVVAEFDERRGIGLVVGSNGERHGFHCTGIRDGSRTIGVGARVNYGLRIGPLGREEATAISPV